MKRNFRLLPLLRTWIGVQVIPSHANGVDEPALDSRRCHDDARPLRRSVTFVDEVIEPHDRSRLAAVAAAANELLNRSIISNDNRRR